MQIKFYRFREEIHVSEFLSQEFPCCYFLFVLKETLKVSQVWVIFFYYIFKKHIVSCRVCGFVVCSF